MSDRRHPQILPTKKPVHTLERYSEADLPTEQGTFHLVVFRDRLDRAEHVALIVGDVAGREGVPVRVHSECLTGEVFGVYPDRNTLPTGDVSHDHTYEIGRAHV